MSRLPRYLTWVSLMPWLSIERFTHATSYSVCCTHQGGLAEQACDDVGVQVRCWAAVLIVTALVNGHGATHLAKIMGGKMMSQMTTRCHPSDLKVAGDCVCRLGERCSGARCLGLAHPDFQYLATHALAHVNKHAAPNAVVTANALTHDTDIFPQWYCKSQHLRC